jgi:hypothetical protein
MFRLYARRHVLLFDLLAGVLSLGLIGCEEPAEIRVQTVPKQVIEPAEFAGLTDPEHTLLAAMVPQENDAWVFRIDGPREEVAAQRDAFEAFITSVSFVAGQSRPNWHLPEGWEESETAADSLREASIRVPVKGGRNLDLSVSRLPMREDWLHYRLRNFNRWRTQLQLPVAGADELAAASKTIELQNENGPTSTDQKASLIVVSGKLGDRPMAGVPHGMPATSTRSDPGADSAGSGTESMGLTYATPAGWGPGPTSSMRRASFVISEDGKQATVAVTAFSRDSGPQMTSPLANVNRWRGQLGLPPVSEEELSQAIEPIEIDGQEGLYVAIDGTDGAAAGRAMRAAMIEHADLVWFFKLDGPQEIVARETERFRQFLLSVEFT